MRIGSSATAIVPSSARLGKWACTLVLLGLTAAMVWHGPLPAVKKFNLEGDFIHFSAQQAEQLLREASVDRGYFTMDLDELRKRFEAFAWVKRAQLVRVWPQTVKIILEEHQPFAFLNGSALVSAEGSVFHPPLHTVNDSLPFMDARPESAARLVHTMKKFNAWMEGLELRIAALKETKRQALHLHLTNGWILALGRLHQEKRFERFLKVYPKLADGYFFHRIDRIDLRYPDGFAIACRQEQPCRL